MAVSTKVLVPTIPVAVTLLPEMLQAEGTNSVPPLIERRQVTEVRAYEAGKVRVRVSEGVMGEVA